MQTDDISDFAKGKDVASKKKKIKKLKFMFEI